MHNIYYTTKLDVIIQCELGREPGGQTSLPDNNLVLVSVNDINSFMTILIIIIFGVFNLCQHFEISYSRNANKHYITGVYIAINDI